MLQSSSVMNNEQADNAKATAEEQSSQGFIRRYRLPLFLAVVAVCLYAGSILYILFGRGPVA